MIQGYPPIAFQQWLDALFHPVEQRCEICNELFIGTGPLCPDCAAWEEQAERDHRDEIMVAFAATNGTL